LLAGKEVHHIAFSSYERDWQIWISTDDDMPLPLMIIGTESHEQGWPQFRVNLMDWDLSSSIDISQFSYEPDEGMTPITLPFLVEEDGDDQQASAENLTGQALDEGEAG
jgi:hypothetical protein